MLDLRLLFVALVWGMNFAIVKFSLADFLPLSFTIARFLSAGMFLLLLARLSGDLVPIRRGDRLPLIILGLIGITLYNVLFMYGLYFTSASNSALFISLSPLFAALIQAASGKERISGRMWTGLCLAMLGAMLVIGSNRRGFAFTSVGSLGDFLSLGASVLWALYTVTAKPLLGKYPPILVTAWAMTAGSVMLLPLGLPELTGQNWAAIPAVSWLAFLFAALIAGGIAHTLWYDGVKRIGVTRTAAYHYLMPFAAVSFAAVFLRERITPSQIAGGICILSGVALVQKVRKT